MELAGKVALITGAQQGIGRAMAVAFANAGADIGIHWHDDEAQAEEVRTTLYSLGRRAVLLQGDLSRIETCRYLVDETVARLGRIDILINNAGVFPRASFLEMDEQTFDSVMSINLKAGYFCAQAAARQMVTAGVGGSIINVSSRSIQGRTPSGSHYAASKMAVVGMTRGIATELAGHNIRVNAIAPGLTDTAQPRYGHDEEELAHMSRQVPLGRMVQPCEVADLAVYLCTDRARMITGQICHINGGSFYG